MVLLTVTLQFSINVVVFLSVEDRVPKDVFAFTHSILVEISVYHNGILLSCLLMSFIQTSPFTFSA